MSLFVLQHQTRRKRRGITPRLRNKQIDGKLIGVTQDLTIGKEYLSKEKTWRHEFRVRKMIKQGLIMDFVNRSDKLKLSGVWSEK